MTKNNCELTLHDPFIVLIREREELAELFGEEEANETLVNDGLYIEPKLLQEYKRIISEWNVVQDKLHELYKNRPLK